MLLIWADLLEINVLGERLRTLRFDPLRSVKFVLKTRKRLIWMVVKTLDIDGRPRFAKLSIDNVKKVEIAAIDPDFIEAE
jgi:hypothetical protein